MLTESDHCIFREPPGNQVIRAEPTFSTRTGQGKTDLSIPSGIGVNTLRQGQARRRGLNRSARTRKSASTPARHSGPKSISRSIAENLCKLRLKDIGLLGSYWYERYDTKTGCSNFTPGTIPNVLTFAKNATVSLI